MDIEPPVGSAVPRRGHRRAYIAAAVIGLLALTIGIGFATSLIQIYDAPGNAGVVVGWTCNNIGFEWRGVPGMFVDSCE